MRCHVVARIFVGVRVSGEYPVGRESRRGEERTDVNIVDLCPDAPATINVLNRTPLQVDAGTGAGHVVIKALADAYPQACTISNIQRK